MPDSRYDSRWVGRMPFALRVVRFLLLRPFLVFAGYFLLVAVLALAPDPRDAAGFYLLTAPWVLIFMLCLHLPLIAAALRRFRLPRDVRINHALEHGTIFFLRRRCGKKFKIGGQAEADGFRVNGMPSPELVVPAFGELRDELGKGNTKPVVSRHCGSMLVTAQALSALFLTAVAVAFLLFSLRRQTKVELLLLVLLAYLLLRHGIGLLLQRWWFLSVDFTEAEVRSVKQVKPRGPLERQPVYFVRTVVR